MHIYMGMAQSTSQDRPSATNGAPATTALRKSLGSRLRKIFSLYHRESKHATPATPAPATEPPPPANPPPTNPTTPVNPRRTGMRSVVPGLPRPPTLQRMQSEKRDRLRPYEPPNHERRALSTDRRSPLSQPQESLQSLNPIPNQSITSIPDSPEIRAQDEAAAKQNRDPVPGVLDFSGESRKEAQAAAAAGGGADEKAGEGKQEAPQVAVKKDEVAQAVQAGDEHIDASLPRPERGPRESEPQIISASEEGLSDASSESWDPRADRESPLVSREIEDEMEWRWILNLSMHFRDESSREKFFVTYAQERNLRRRITISCDYRNAEEGTLEKELSRLRFQREKSAKIYESIRDSLQDILFYDTITNLKLQTSEGRLHVHVTEDINEIIPYPPVMAIAHLKCHKYCESELDFDSHLSGFVYKVGVGGRVMIKKEIPGPDTVDEFLYEINALYALADSDNVIQFGGCVIDDQRQRVKGLLISYAPKGALIDILFNQRGKLPWYVRERWAKQIVSGLSEIHEAGYVQGDFTLSNIVIDEHDNAKIIDINRRGCPVGWEPPEITAMIHGLQRIGMYIGVKSDIFQLGMVLWGMAHERDEPEAVNRPLTMDQVPDDVPAYFREIVETCLCDRPQGRPSAKDLIGLFPERIDDAPYIVEPPRNWGSSNGYFPETYDLEQKEPPTREPLESSPYSISTSFPPLSQQSSRPRPSEDLISPTTQVIDAIPSEDLISPIAEVIDATPSESEFSELMPPNNPMVVSASSSVVGGVGLEHGGSESGGGGVLRVSRLGGGVAISAEEYTQLIRPATRSTERAETPRPRRDTENDRIKQQQEPEWEEDHHKHSTPPTGVQTPATEILNFVDAKESLTSASEEDPPSPLPPTTTAVVGIVA